MLFISLSSIVTLFIHIKNALLKLISNFSNGANEVIDFGVELKDELFDIEIRDRLFKILKQDNLLLKVFYFDNYKFFMISFFVFVLSYILYSYFPIEVSIIKFNIWLCTIIFFSFIGVYIDRFWEKENKVAKFFVYITKLSVLIIYSLFFLRLFLEYLNNIKLLFMAIFIPVIYSFLFIKRIIENYKSITVQMISLTLVLIILNLAIIGLCFGGFYLNNYKYFPYFTKTDYKEITQNKKTGNIYFIIYKGMKPFFDYPDHIVIRNDFYGYVPLIEHFIGYIFNLILISFFISYATNKIS